VDPVTAQQLVRGAWPPDGDGREWALACRGDGTSREKAVGRLRAFLVAVAWFEADRRRPQLRSLTPRETAALVCDAAEAALTAVVDRLSEYRGQSRFATWAAKFAIHETALACRVANDRVRTADQGVTNELWAVGEAKERPARWG
jgi:RNA polymerase sigma-70 factor, ECF subfamily